MGKILAYSGVMVGFRGDVDALLRSEMRGGTANVTVILRTGRFRRLSPANSTRRSSSNQQSMEKFEPMVKPGGVLIHDTNGITRHPVRKDIGSLCDRRHGRVCEDVMPNCLNTDDTRAVDSSAPCGRDGEREDSGSESALPRARAWKMLPANGGGHPPRRRDSPQAVIQKGTYFMVSARALRVAGALSSCV